MKESVGISTKYAKSALNKLLFDKSRKRNDNIDKAFTIYNNINDESMDPHIINLIMKICLNYNQPHKIINLWNDIKDISNSPYLSLHLLLKCYANINNDNKDNINNCIEILKWIKRYNQRSDDPSEFSRNCIKIINKCTNINQLNEIYSLINNFKDKHLITSWIIKYQRFGDISKALNIFQSSPNPLLMENMITVLFKNGKYQQVIDLYEQYGQNEDISIRSNIFFIKACKELNQYEKGKEHHAKCISINDNTDFLNVLLEFYGHFGEIEIVNKLFDENKDIHNVHTIGSMMKAYLDNALYTEILNIYTNKNDSFESTLIDLYAIKASINLNNYDVIFSNHNINLLKPSFLRLLFNTILENGDPTIIEIIWNKHLYKFDNHLLKLIFDSECIELLIFCIDCSSKYYLYHDDKFILISIWNKLIDSVGIQPNLKCFCMAIFAFSKYNKKKEYKKIFKSLIYSLINNKNFIYKLSLNDKTMQFHQILTAIGNMNNLDLLHLFYDKVIINNNKPHNITALNILLQFETRPNVIKKILNIINTNSYLNQCSLCKFYTDYQCNLNDNNKTSKNCIIEFEKNDKKNNSKEFDVNNLRLYECMSLYNYSKIYSDDKLKTKIWNLLNNPVLYNTENMIALFKLNGKQFMIENGIDNQCIYNSITKLNKLFKDSNHVIDDSAFNASLRNKKTKELHFKYHAEKKALAILLDEDKDNENIEITISMSMCNDCHSFFENVSKCYNNKTIKCVDIKGTHTFNNGKCSLCT